MIQLRILGTLELLDDEGEVMESAMRRPKVLAVLAYLATARPRGMQRRDKIAALFWPDLPADRARAALRVTLTRLRDDVGAEVILSRGVDEIAIDPAILSCDVALIEEALARGDVDAAASLYRGPLMDGVHVERTAVELEEWISSERERTRGLLLEALIRDVQRRMALGQHAAAATLARLAAEIAPDDETAHRALITSLMGAADRGAALRAYEALERRLSREFGVKPSPETRALVDSDRLDVTSPTAAVSPGAEPENYHVIARTSRGRVAVFAALAAAVVFVGGAVAVSNRLVHPLTAAPPHWSLVRRAGNSPRTRIGSGAVLDSTAEGIIVFGGQGYGDDAKSSVILGDLWRLAGLHPAMNPTWARLAPTGAEAPKPRWLFGIAYDRAHDRVLVQGGAHGFTSPCANDTWVLDDATGIARAPAWRKVAVRGAAPIRAGMGTVFDASRRRLILFGGHDCIATFYHDIWILAFDDSTLSSGAWSRLSPDSSRGFPMSRSASAIAYDTADNRLFVHGGSSGQRLMGELWVLDHANGFGGRPEWRPLRCENSAPARSSASAIFDRESESLLVFGGVDSTEDFHREMWRVTGLSGSGKNCRWEEVALGEPGPSARGGAALLYDAASRTAFLFGGHFQSSGLNDTWILTDPFRKY